MSTNKRLQTRLNRGTCTLRAGALLIVTFALASIMVISSTRPAAAATLPNPTCTLTAGTFTCDLYAKAGTLTLPDATIAQIWGYAATSAGPATLPGPTLVVTAGLPVNINLHNVNVPGATSLAITQQTMLPDTTGVTAGNSKTYSFAATDLQPGTYLYEAGLTPDGPRQVAMGLFGALVVRPASCASCAYATIAATSTYSDEALLVLSEVDPAFNAAPTTFNMSDFAPRYWLINGKGYPNTDQVLTAAGHKVLLRYVNAGLKHHSMGLLGLRQLIIATDGKVKTNPFRVAAQTIPTGGTLDTIAAVTTTAPLSTTYVIYEAAMHTDNNGILSTPANPNPAYTPIAFGGMLTLMKVVGGVPVGQPPVTSNVAITPNPANGQPAGNGPASGPATLSATINAMTGTLTAAEYFVDTIGANGAGCAITGATGTTANVSVAIPQAGPSTAPCTDLTTLPSGNHTFYVHGHNSAGLWGVAASVVLNLDKTGPALSNIGLTPNVTNGTVDVQLQATASDVATGNQNVTAAEYFIDSQPAATVRGTALTLVPPLTTIMNLTATIAAATVLALPEGNHTVAIRAQDALGNWGAFGTFTLVVDKTGPTTSLVSTAPTPTNGTFGIQNGSFGGFFQMIYGTATDPLSGGVQSNIAAIEFFIDCQQPIATTCPNGTGGPMIANDGSFNQTVEGSYAALPLYIITAAQAQDKPANPQANPVTGSAKVYLPLVAADAVVQASAYVIPPLSQGQHTIYVHGLDAAGNWGPLVTTILVVDKTGPNITSASLTPNPTLNATSTTLTASATDPINTAKPPATVNGPASNIVAGEWFIGADPGLGLGNPMNVATPAPTANLVATISLAGRAPGTYTVSVRAKDAATNWGPVATLTLTVGQPDAIFANGFDSNVSPFGWSATGGTAGRISVTTGATQAGTYKMQAQISAGTSGYVQDNTPTNETSYHARFYFNPNNVTLGTATPNIFVGLTSSNANVFIVQLRRNGGNYQVRTTVSRAGGTTSTNWYNINNNAWNAIEIAWASGNPASFSLYTGGTLRQTLNGLNTSGFTLRTVRLGPQGTLTGVTGNPVYFDSFVSTRYTVIGP